MNRPLYRIVALASLVLLCIAWQEDASAQRRPARIDAGGWGSNQSLDSPACSLDLPGSGAHLEFGGVTFSFHDDSGLDLRAGGSCQPTVPGVFNGTVLPPDEGPLSGLVGPNFDHAVSAVRYTFATSDFDPFGTTGSAVQWLIYQLPDGLVLVSLQLTFEGQQDVDLGAFGISHVNDGWQGGYFGEYFCFDGSQSPMQYLGSWDGTYNENFDGCHAAIRQRHLTPGVVSRTRSGLLNGVDPNGNLGSLSGDARRAVHQPANQSPAQLQLLDRATGEAVRIDQSHLGVPANAESYDPHVAPPDDQGRTEFVAFTSLATNLHSQDADSFSDVYVKYLPDGGVFPISFQVEDQDCFGGHLSEGAAFAVFTCVQQGFARPITHWFYDRLQFEFTPFWSTTLPYFSFAPVISGNGRYAVFSTDAPILPDDTNDLFDVYLYDRIDSSFERVSVPNGGGVGNSWSWEPAVSRDGCQVAFESPASNMVAGDTNGGYDVFVRDRCAGRTELISVGLSGQILAGDSRRPSMTADGAYVAYETTDPGLRAAAGLDLSPGYKAVAMRRRGGAPATRIVQTASIAGQAYARSASQPVMRASHGLDQTDFQGIQDLMVTAEDAGGAVQAAVVNSPFPVLSNRIFSGDFE